jgi:hypothetical protein
MRDFAPVLVISLRSTTVAVNGDGEIAGSFRDKLCDPDHHPQQQLVIHI